jgi:hypothetical protein
VLPRHQNSTNAEYTFASPHFTSGSGGAAPCDSSGTFVLRPAGPGTVTNLQNSGCTDNYECVEEVTGDGDASTVGSYSNSYVSDLYALDSPPSSDCDINSVAVFVSARKAQSVGTCKVLINTGGTTFEGAEQSLTTSYVEYSEVWTTNPSTGAPWAWSDLSSLQAGIDLAGQNAARPAYCTQVWVEVTYGY